MNTLLRSIPGLAAARTQIQIWRDQLADLRPIYPIAVPALLWIFLRSYRNERERLRLERLDPVLVQSKRLPQKKQGDG